MEFSLQNGIIIRGHRTVIPKTLRTVILEELHSGPLRHRKNEEFSPTLLLVARNRQ